MFGRKKAKDKASKNANTEASTEACASKKQAKSNGGIYKWDGCDSKGKKDGI